MGYHTDFNGEFSCSPALSADHLAYLERFAQVRHCKRDVKVLETIDDPLRVAVGLPIGEEGEFFVGDTASANATEGNGVNKHQPGVWCQWVPTEDGAEIVWDEGEKFYDYVEWIEYLVENFIKPWGYKLNGAVNWNGDEPDDVGTIQVFDNEIVVTTGQVLVKSNERVKPAKIVLDSFSLDPQKREEKLLAFIEQQQLQQNLQVYLEEQG